MIDPQINPNNKLIIKKEYRAVVVFDDGSYILQKTFEKASRQIITLELCFTTSLIGYQEIMTDPSYAGQALIFSFPHIGNTGINDEDNESCQIYTKAVMMNERPSKPSNFRSEKTFENWVLKNNIICVFGADTRDLIKKIRKGQIKNACFGVFDDGEEVNLDQMISLAKNYTYNFTELIGPILSCESRKKEIEKIVLNSSLYEIKQEGFKPKTLVLDYGVKLNILRCLVENCFDLKDVLPFDSNPESVDFSKYDCIVFSNGPGDPKEAFKLSEELVLKTFESGLPILGICLGHQIIGLSHPKLKMEAFKMSQGHRGANHPVKNLSTSKVEITSQNHGFALRATTEESKKFINHCSLFDESIAGLFLPEEKILTVQYHPESSSGTHDSRYIFKDFFKLCS
jgi:carbamoyl-phosphate synthase small subunit